jgi:acylphosphatase
MNIRARIIVKGKVQKGGYRYIVNEAAFSHNLTGLVGNRDDGTVEIICEGQKKAIQKFQRSIRIRDPLIQVCSLHIKYQPATGEFRYFDILPETDPARAILERADAAASALRAMDQHISGKLDQRIGQVRSGIHTMDSHIRTMDSNIGGHFNRLDRKYDSFGRTLKTVSKDMKGANSSLKTVSKDTKRMASDIRGVRADIRQVRPAGPWRRKKA